MGHGRSSATAKRGIKGRVNGSVGGVKTVFMRTPFDHESARGETFDAVRTYMASGGGDTKMINALLSGDTESDYGKLAAAADSFAIGKGTDKTLYRGVALTDKQFKQLKTKGYLNRDTLSSWSDNSGVAREFATGNATQNAFSNLYDGTSLGTVPVMFVAKGGINNAFSVNSAAGVRRLFVSGGKTTLASSYTEGEWISNSKNKFNVVGYDSSSFKKFGVHIFEVEQI